MRICLFSERMAPPFDEGIKNFALHLARALGREHELLTLTTRGQSIPALGIENIRANPLLLSLPLATRVQRFKPDLLLYVPTACATLFSFLRARVLKAFGRGAPVVLVALQPRRYGRLARLGMPRLRPDLVLAQSEATRSALQRLGCRVRPISSGIDLEHFKPASAVQRAEIRREYGVPQGDYVVLHVGHLNRERNVQALLGLQQPGTQVMVAGSTSTAHDASLVSELTQAGVRVIAHYVPDIAALYQLADCYVFPACAQTSAIDIPLSVLEALACDLPVVTTRFGGLPAAFAAAPAFRYADTPEERAAAVAACKQIDPAGARALAQPYAWPRIAERVLEEVRGLLRSEERRAG